MESNYQTLGMSNSLEKQAKRNRRSKLIVIGSIIVIVVLAAIGTVVGILISKNNSNKSSSSSSSKASVGNDPSVFKKDSNLHKAFYGLAYTPEGSLPDFGCSSTLEGVIKDIQIMSQLTTRVRLYGSDCNQSALVLEAVKQTKVDLEIYLGNFVVADDPGAYERQRDVIKSAIETYGTKHIKAITVGNEFMLNYVVNRNSKDPNSAIGDEGAEILLANIADTRTMLASMKLDKEILVGNSDAGSYFNTKVLSAVDYGLSNVHAWFANTTAEGASDWVTNFFEETNVQPAALLPNKPVMYLAETGWPTDSKDLGNANNGAADASIANLQVFIDSFLCQANANGLPYFFFEFFDEVWKDQKFGGVEGHWGLFDENRNLKAGLKIPTCTAP